MNAAWFWEMKEGIIIESLVARVLVVILNEKLRRLIGQNSMKVVGEGLFGITAMKKVFQNRRSRFVMKKVGYG